MACTRARVYAINFIKSFKVFFFSENVKPKGHVNYFFCRIFNKNKVNKYKIPTHLIRLWADTPIGELKNSLIFFRKNSTALHSMFSQMCTKCIHKGRVDIFAEASFEQF